MPRLASPSRSYILLGRIDSFGRRSAFSEMRRSSGSVGDYLRDAGLSRRADAAADDGRAGRNFDIDAHAPSQLISRYDPWCRRVCNGNRKTWRGRSAQADARAFLPVGCAPVRTDRARVCAGRQTLDFEVAVAFCSCSHRLSGCLWYHDDIDSRNRRASGNRGGDNDGAEKQKSVTDSHGALVHFAARAGKAFATTHSGGPS